MQSEDAGEAHGPADGGGPVQGTEVLQAAGPQEGVHGAYGDLVLAEGPPTEEGRLPTLKED